MNVVIRRFRKSLIAIASLFVLTVDATTLHAQESAPASATKPTPDVVRPSSKRRETPPPVTGPVQTPARVSTRPKTAAPAAAIATGPAAPVVPRQAQMPDAVISDPPSPPHVVTVIHRLSGWKLLARLASERLPVIGVEELPFNSDVHTNIVAGFVADDGRTVVARLGQTEAEAEANGFFAQPKRPAESKGAVNSDKAENSDLTIVRGDGRRFKARFIGLDASTGLSFLETAQPLIAPVQKRVAEKVLAGQRVRLFAPAPVRPAIGPAITGMASTGPTKHDAKVFLNIDEMEGSLGDVKTGPSGNPVEAVVNAEQLTPAWAGAVATDETGALVGIVTRNGPDGTKLIVADAVRRATDRVLQRRASVPQPWLGARGDEVRMAPLERFMMRGWSRERAKELLKKNAGVLLTAVAPDTPAALAGLRTGDVITLVSGKEINSVEDFSLMLKEAGSGSTLDFTVFRAFEPEPLKMSVTLSGAFNPAFATKQAEDRTLEKRFRAQLDEARELQIKARQALASARSAEMRSRREKLEAQQRGDTFRFAELEREIVSANRQLADAQKQADEATKRYNEALDKIKNVERELVQSRMPKEGFSYKTQLIPGLDVIAMSPQIAARSKAQKGLLVIGVRPGTIAAASGLRPGDVIESINGQMLHEPESAFSYSFRSSGPAINLGVVRDGQKITIKVEQRAKR